MKIIDGKEIAKEIREKLHQEIVSENLKPGLAIIMVGNNPASEIKGKLVLKLGLKKNYTNIVKI